MATAEDPPEGYRPCAGAVVFNARGLVFAGRRAGLSKDAAFAWQMPQGGMDAGETPEEAARRELLEETGIRSVTLAGAVENWLTYDFPPEVRGKRFGKYRGQAQRWFAYDFTGTEDEIDLQRSHPPEFQQWDWISLKSLPSLIVPFKRQVYTAIVAALGPLAEERRRQGD